MGSSSGSRDGRRVARLFNQYRDVGDDERACDLHRILEEDGIELVTSDVRKPGYTACLLCPVPDKPGGIILAPGQSRGRTRFSIAHELGHYHIPSHGGRSRGWCGEKDMVAREDWDATLEWEANDFAAELLMPRKPFSRDVEGRDPAFKEIGELASPDMYDVSRTAAALRYVELAKRRCALVCAEDGNIDWVAKSKDFPYRIPWIGDLVPPSSMSAFTFNGEGDVSSLEELDPYVWLEIEQRRPVELFESTLSIPTQDQVLSLMWVVPEGAWA